MPNRREYIATVASGVFLAGCSSIQREQTSTETPTSDNESTQPENETDSGDSEEDKNDIELAFDTAEWYDEGLVAEFIISNRDSVAVQSLEIVVDWYDENGNFIDWDSKRIPALKSGGSWYLHIEKSISSPADSFEVIARYVGQAQNTPDGLVVQSTSVENSDTVTGIISNNQSSETGVSLIEA